MTGDVVLSREQARAIISAVDGIGELLKSMRTEPHEGVLYGIMSNLSVIRLSVARQARVISN